MNMGENILMIIIRFFQVHYEASSAVINAAYRKHHLKTCLKHQEKLDELMHV